MWQCDKYTNGSGNLANPSSSSTVYHHCFGLCLWHCFSVNFRLCKYHLSPFRRKAAHILSYMDAFTAENRPRVAKSLRNRDMWRDGPFAGRDAQPPSDALPQPRRLCNVNDNSVTYPNHQIRLPLPPKTYHERHTSSLFASNARNAAGRRTFALSLSHTMTQAYG